MRLQNRSEYLCLTGIHHVIEGTRLITLDHGCSNLSQLSDDGSLVQSVENVSHRSVLSEDQIPRPLARSAFAFSTSYLQSVTESSKYFMLGATVVGEYLGTSSPDSCRMAVFIQGPVNGLPYSYIIKEVSWSHSQPCISQLYCGTFYNSSILVVLQLNNMSCRNVKCNINISNSSQYPAVGLNNCADCRSYKPACRPSTRHFFHIHSGHFLPMIQI